MTLFDTQRLFNLAQKNINWFELDFDQVVTRKASAIHRNAALKDGLKTGSELDSYKNGMYMSEVNF